MQFVGNALQMVFRYLASVPRQCTMPRGPECQGIFGQAQHPRGFTPALLTRFGPLRLLPLPQAEEHPEGETISRRGGDTTKYDTAVAGHSQTSLPDMHWKVEGSLESLRTIWRIVLWRRQLRVTCRCFRFPTINSVPDIFDQPSYGGVEV
jgi:hypothetical protein